jgi:RNA recognition motif-containing protein
MDIPVVVQNDYVPASDAIPENSEHETEATLFVGNLTTNVTSSTQYLTDFFKQFGRVNVCFCYCC